MSLCDYLIENSTKSPKTCESPSYKGRPQTLKGFDPDPYRVSPSTLIVVDLGPL